MPDADPLALLLLALAVDAYGGGFGLLPDAAGRLRRFVGFLDRKLNRPQRPEGDRAFRGAVVVVILVVPAIVAGALVWAGRLLFAYGWVLELVVLVMLLDARRLFDGGRAVGRALRDQGVDPARLALRPLVPWETVHLDGHGVARGAVEALAVGFGERVVAPVFWYALLGLPGLAAHRVLAVTAEGIGHPTDAHRAFGAAARRLHALAALVPARLAGLILALAALFVPTARPLAALGTVVRQARHYAGPGPGWTVAAAAGALHLCLGGPRPLAAQKVKTPWLGDGRARATPQDVRRMLFLYAVGGLITAALAAVLLILRMGGRFTLLPLVSGA